MAPISEPGVRDNDDRGGEDNGSLGQIDYVANISLFDNWRLQSHTPKGQPKSEGNVNKSDFCLFQKSEI